MLTDIKAAPVLFTGAAVICVLLTLLRSPYSKHFLIICLCVLLATFSFFLADTRTIPAFSLEGKEAVITGTVTEYPVKSSESTYVTELSDCRADGKDFYGKVHIYTSDKISSVPGDKLSAVCSELRTYSTEGIYRYHSLSDGVFLFGFSDNAEVTEKVGKETLIHKIIGLRKYFSDTLSENMSADGAAITSALITGDKNLLSPEISTCFRASGISHIFAVSGMHLSLWTGLFFIIMKQRSKISLIPNLLAICFILFYIVFTGFSPSVLRAGLMLIPAFIAPLIRKKADSLNSLGLAGTVILLINPFTAGNISFLLSFTATLTIVGIAPYFTLFLSEINPVKRKIKNAFSAAINSLLVSFCVILMTLPFCALFFGYICLWSPLSSLLMTPVAEFLMITGSLSVILSRVSFISPLLFYLTEQAAGRIKAYILFISEFDFAIIPVEKIRVTVIFVTVATITLIILFVFRRRRLAVSFVFLSVIALISSVFFMSADKNQGTEIYIPYHKDAFIISITDPAKNNIVFCHEAAYPHISDVSESLTAKGVLRTDYYLSSAYGGHERLAEKMLVPKKLSRLYKSGDAVIRKTDLWNGAQVHSEISPDFKAAVIYCNDIKIVISIDAAQDFNMENDIFRNGDLLICRDAVPRNLEEDCFSRVIILTDESIKPESPGCIISGNKAVTIISEGDSYAVF